MKKEPEQGRKEEGAEERRGEERERNVNSRAEFSKEPEWGCCMTFAPQRFPLGAATSLWNPWEPVE